jgi:disulfide bond formation protein DsbB
MLQRAATLILGGVFLSAFLHDGGRWFARTYGLLILVAAGLLVALSARHVWMQMQPLGSLASCGADFWTMMGMLPNTRSREPNREWWWRLYARKLVGRCFGISIPGWLGTVRYGDRHFRRLGELCITAVRR